MSGIISDNIGNIVVVVILLIAVFFAVRSIVRRRRSGKGSCSCGCDGCPSRSTCHSQDKR